MTLLNIRLFGSLSIQRNGQELGGLHAGKAQELLCYLLLHRDKPHPREALGTLLWGDCTSVQSKKYLRQTLWQLHQGLHGTKPLDHERMLLVDSECVRLDTTSDFRLDVAVMEDAFSPVRKVAGQQLDQAQADALRNATTLYAGDLLEGWFADWCLFERERLQSMYLSMLDKLMAYCESHHEYEDGMAHGEQMLRRDRACERTYIRLMRLQYLAGDRAGAIRQFHRCAAALQEELGVRPAKRTLELFEQIRADSLEHCTPPKPNGVPGQDTALVSLSSLPARLKTIYLLLLQVRNRLDQDLDAVEKALADQSGSHTDIR